ncbi:MAG TPA: MerR family transcriptional regulator [Pyrinomonadaceae bacterium]|jgi:DNA-binding transcriptional MerR regulator|nr:MerR family transcriptional regulator [Pyrinomonadaceae bacterium]
MNRDDKLWQTREFAKLAGLTVRTLHHYDRIGLLKPARRDHNGFRLYTETDFAKLEQIQTLKFIGFPLKQIKAILKDENLKLDETLRLQRKILEAQRYRLGIALEAIKRAEEAYSRDGGTDFDAFDQINEVINMEQNTEWTKKYYSEEAQAKVEERKALWSPELQERVTRDWAELVADIEAAMADGVASMDARAQELAARWRGFVGQFTGGDPGIQKGLNKMYAHEKNWQTEWKKPFSDEVQTWIVEAMKSGS